MELNSKGSLKGCVFVDSQNVYYTLKKWIDNKIPENGIRWNMFFDDVFQRISELNDREVKFNNSYWFRPTKFIDYYPEKRMTKYHLKNHFDESIANQYLDKSVQSTNISERNLLRILFEYEKGKDKVESEKSKKKYEKISKRYRDFCMQDDKMVFIETGFIKYDFIKKERNEKAVDVSLASHLLFCAMASEKQLKVANGSQFKIPPSDVVVLLSNDDDYIETVGLLEAIDFPVYVICFRTSKNQKSGLMDKSRVNRFIYSREDMNKYMLKEPRGVALAAE